MTATNGLLYDQFLTTLAGQVDDFEAVRKAMANRYRQLTRTENDKDGELRGFGMSEDDPDVQRIKALTLALNSHAFEKKGPETGLEVDAVRQLERHMRRSVWKPWLAQATGVGEKQLARLLAAIGDPYWNAKYQRPRIASELIRYCGLDPVAVSNDPDAPRVARKKRQGTQAKWSHEARMRAWNIAGSCIKTKGHYRDVYDATRAKYADAIHVHPCPQCGTASKPGKPGVPAPIGSPLNDGHKHGRALRAIARKVLLDLWIEARRLHGVTDETPHKQPASQRRSGAQGTPAGGPQLSTDAAA